MESSSQPGVKPMHNEVELPSKPCFLMNQPGAITPHRVVKINGQHIFMHLALVPGAGSVISETDFK